MVDIDDVFVPVPVKKPEFVQEYLYIHEYLPPPSKKEIEPEKEERGVIIIQL